MNTARLALAALLVSLLAACGGGDDEDQAEQNEPTTCVPAECQSPK